MKKFKARKLIAIVLIVMQIATLCAIGVSAADNTKIYRTDPATMVLDGAVTLGEYWGEIPMQRLQITADATVEGVKWMWGSDSGGTYIYFFFTYIDSNGVYNKGAQGWDGDGFIVGIDEKGNTQEGSNGYTNTDDLHRCSTQYTSASTKVITSDWLSYFIVRAGNLVNIEGKIKIKGETNVTVNSTIGLNIMGQPNNGEAYTRVMLNGKNPSDNPKLYVKYSLSDIYAERVNVRYELTDPVVFYSNNKPLMTKTFNDGSTTEIDLPTVILGQTVAAWRDRADTSKIYAPGSTITYSGAQRAFDAIIVAPITQAGAAVYMLDPNKLGFTMDVYGYDNAKNNIAEVGFLTMEADSLTDEIMATKMDKKALDDAGVTYTEHKASTASQTYRAEIPVSQYDVRYAALSFVTVRYSDNSTQTFYSEFNKVYNIRSARDVAAAAYGDRTQVKVENYTFKQGKTYGCLGFETFSYSPYANVELKVLKFIGGLS